MGHNRLGTLPDTRPWREVVGRIADGASPAVVAAATSRAAVGALDRAKADPVVGHVVFLLARTVQAAREPDFARALGGLGVFVPPAPGLFDLTAGFATAVDDWQFARAPSVPRTDVGEMAALAATECLARCVGDRTRELFPGGGDTRRAARELSTEKGFAALAHDFFTRFVRRFLMYHLGRELSLHVGGNGRFADPAAHTTFVEDLDAHAGEAAVVVRTFAGGWYAKTRVKDGVTEPAARGFAAHCLTKLQAELVRRGAPDV